MKKINLMLISLFMMSGCSLEIYHPTSITSSDTIISSSFEEEITSSIAISSTENSGLTSSTSSSSSTSESTDIISSEVNSTSSNSSSNINLISIYLSSFSPSITFTFFRFT